MPHRSTSPVRASRVNLALPSDVHIWPSPDSASRGCPAALRVTARTRISTRCFRYFLLSLSLPFNLMALFHRTSQRILAKFTTVPRAFKRWNIVYWLNYRSCLSLFSSFINHLLSMTLKRKIQAIILINKVNASGATDSWNMVLYLSCLLWTLRCVSPCWCEL